VRRDPGAARRFGGAVVFVSSQVEAMTAGRIELDVHEPGALVPPLEVLDAVSAGTQKQSSQTTGKR
jgi:TRAP-type mannitol/chloroaromatic compound transport system substrate-binding protein